MSGSGATLRKSAAKAIRASPSLDENATLLEPSIPKEPIVYWEINDVHYELDAGEGLLTSTTLGTFDNFTAAADFFVNTICSMREDGDIDGESFKSYSSLKEAV